MLSTGMLWFDDSAKRTLTQKVERAAAYYYAKYGAQPNICYVSKGAKSLPPGGPTSVRVLPLQGVLPNHFWIGVATLKPEDTQRSQN